MIPDIFERRKRTKLVFAVLAVGVVVSALVGVGLFYLGQMRPPF
jgi:hypothetical protein